MLRQKVRNGAAALFANGTYKKRLSSVAVEAPPMLRVALVGRPNTGKSTLYNRLTRSRMAIVSSVAGTTRDRREGAGNLAGLPLAVVDTGGLDDRGTVSLHIQQQVEKALVEADVVLFMLDARAGITALDQHFAKWLRRRMGLIDGAGGGGSGERATRKKEVSVVANRTEGALDSNNVLDALSEAPRLGLGEPVAISASHGDGMADLATSLIELARRGGFATGDEEAKMGSKKNDSGPISLEDRTIQLAIMGRPNVGKSTLVNSILGEERVITGATPGLTRDAVHVEWEFHGRNFRLVDTAGLTRIRPDQALLSAAEENKRQKMAETVGPTSYRQPSGDEASSGGGSGSSSGVPRKEVKLPGIEQMDPEADPSQFSYQVSEMALMSALNALRFAQVVLLVVDGDQGKFSQVDLQLARKCLDEGRALVIAGNKKDLVLAKGVSGNAYEDGIRAHCEELLREFGDVPVVSCCATSGNGTRRLLDTVVAVHDAWSKRVPTGVLNNWLKETLVTAAVPRASGKPLKLKYITQVKARPPTFALFCNVPELPGFFERFLRSRIQQDFQLQGVPLRFEVKKTVGAAVDQARLKQGKHTRRGVGHGEGRGVGPNRRDVPDELRKSKSVQDERRRRDTRLRNQRSAR